MDECVVVKQKFESHDGHFVFNFRRNERDPPLGVFRTVQLFLHQGTLLSFLGTLPGLLVSEEIVRLTKQKKCQISGKIAFFKTVESINRCGYIGICKCVFQNN